jgi:PhoH-like ATPase
MKKSTPDSNILAGCCYLIKKYPDDDIILVTDDVDMSLLADILGIKAQHFRNHSLSDEELSYTGRGDIYLSTESIQSLRNGNHIHTDQSLEINQFLISRDASNPDKNTVLSIHLGNGEISALSYQKIRPCDIYAKNSGQRFMQEAMLAPASDIPLVIINGPAGTAKTFISLACGLEKTLNSSEYKRILITRANVEMDASYGYLPGSESEKVGPMMRPFYDNLEKIIDPKGSSIIKDGQECPSPVQELFDRGTIRMEALQYMRGRSISDTYVIIDEAQNCTPNQILSIVSRIGYGSKIVLIGDSNQIDNKILNKRNNGLVFAARRFKGSKLCAQIVMEQTECVRSPLAAEAAKRLSPDYRGEF